MLEKAVERYKAQNPSPDSTASQGPGSGSGSGFQGADEYQAVRAAKAKGAVFVPLSATAAAINSR